MDYEKLLESLKCKAAEAPEDVLLMSKLAIVYMENNLYDEAFGLLKRAAANNPGVETLTNLGWFYLHEGRLAEDGYYINAAEEAVDILERAVAYSPESWLTYSALGEAYLMTNRLNEAEQLLGKSVEIEANGSNLNNLGAALYKQDRICEASVWFEKAYEYLQGQKDNFRTGVNYAVTMALLGERGRAEEIARHLLNDRKNNELYFDILDIAQIYYAAENFREAIKMFEACEYSLGMDWLELYAFALTAGGKKQQAASILEEYIGNNRLQIMEYKNDNELEAGEAKELVQETKAEIDRLKELLGSLESEEKPRLEFEPYLVDHCYLYGCLRHGNPDTDKKPLQVY